MKTDVNEEMANGNSHELIKQNIESEEGAWHQ
jgi:hypothetical protein